MYSNTIWWFAFDLLGEKEKEKEWDERWGI
jgi:hypothetical protein